VVTVKANITTVMRISLRAGSACTPPFSRSFSYSATVFASIAIAGAIPDGFASGSQVMVKRFSGVTPISPSVFFGVERSW
jgi:hypothetical protein